MAAKVRIEWVRIGVLASLFIVSTAGLARSQPGWPPIIGGQFRPLTVLRGEIVCIDCTLTEVRRAQPNAINLYEMKFPGGLLVMNITWVNQQSRQYLEDVAGLTDTLRLRGSQSMIEQLTDDLTRSREVKLTGILRSTRTFDILDVEVQPG
jgi:hypothetical protein